MLNELDFVAPGCRRSASHFYTRTEKEIGYLLTLWFTLHVFKFIKKHNTLDHKMRILLWEDQHWTGGDDTIVCFNCRFLSVSIFFFYTIRLKPFKYCYWADNSGFSRGNDFVCGYL